MSAKVHLDRAHGLALLRDMMRIDQRIGELQFELRHLQAARQLYGSGVRQAIQEEGVHDNDSEPAGNGHLD